MQAQNRVPFQVRKDHAVFTALFLIFLALLLSRVMPLLVPQEKPILELVVGGFFLTFSYSMVNALVGGAIDFAAEEKQRDFLDKQSPDSIHTLQELEYYSVIPPEHRKQAGKLLSVQTQTLEDIEQDSRVRDTIVCGLANEDVLRRIAVKACAVALRKEDDRAYLETDLRFARFRQDIYIYLRAWLIMSIKYKREMSIDLIQQGFPDENSPDKYAYIRAIRYIREKSINKLRVEECLKAEHIESAKVILRQELDKLIETLHK